MYLRISSTADLCTPVQSCTLRAKKNRSQVDSLASALPPTACRVSMSSQDVLSNADLTLTRQAGTRRLRLEDHRVQ
jgi:hypothetical protein